MIKKGFLVKGIVQGVGFRYFVLRRARLYNLKGFVKNLDDGSVEVRAFGSDEAISSLKKDLEIGPPAASVFSVTPFDISDRLEDYGGFEIQY